MMETDSHNIQEDVVKDTVEDHIIAAKAYLLRSSEENGVSVYSHLVNLLKTVLDQQPEGALSILEELSRKQKKYAFYPPKDTIQDTHVTPTAVVLAHEQKALFSRKDVKVPDKVADSDADEEQRMSVPDVMENAFYFEQVGVGLGREELLRTLLALKQLSDTYALKSCRFWGKILGIDHNYIVAEVEFRDGEDHYDESQLSERDDVISAQVESKDGVLSSAPVSEVAEYEALPKPDYRPPPVIPAEPSGEGCNKKVYFVCNDAGLSWSRLPPVTPAQISVARQIRKLMTGRLEEPVISYPPFPGNESNYLRAQIARITAATQVSPQGYYIFEEDEEEEEDVVRTAIMENVEFEGVPVGDLTDPGMTFWVHHQPYILPQGRTTWFNPAAKTNEEDVEEEEDEDEREELDEVQPEDGPPILTPLSEDREVNGMPAWTAQRSTSLVLQYAIAAVHSNLWPGAHAFAFQKRFENIYIGYGVKYIAENYSPPVPPLAQEEYPSGPDITEADDPTAEQERALRAAQQEAIEAEDEGESEEIDEDD